MQHYKPAAPRSVQVKRSEQQIFYLTAFRQYEVCPVKDGQIGYSIELACIY